MKIFIGFDARETIAYHVLSQSIIEKTTIPVSITPLAGNMLRGFDGQRDGTNSFIYSRFLVPELTGFEGWALYLDSDMLARVDLAPLMDMMDHEKAVHVVKHDYLTKHRRKLIGTPMECDNVDYPRKNWSSMILWNCGHPSNKIVTRQFVQEQPGSFLHRFSWLNDHEIGELDPSWNHLVGEYPKDDQAKIVHFTHGAPCFSHYRKCDYANEWHALKESVNTALDKTHLMGVA